MDAADPDTAIPGVLQQHDLHRHGCFPHARRRAGQRRADLCRDVVQRGDAVVFTQPYTSLFQLGNDEAHSRIWGGIHYRFDIEASQVSCTQVADYLFDNYMRPNRMARH